MQRYREAVQHLNDAIQLMEMEGDSLMVAHLATPLAIAEAAIVERGTKDTHARTAGQNQRATGKLG